MENNIDKQNNPPWWQMHRRLYNWVVHWADTRFGVIALIILAITEPVIVPVPADVLVIGLCLGRPKNSIKYGLLCSAFSILGGVIAFSLGLLIGGENVVAFFNRINLGPTVEEALKIYRKYDFWAVAIAALTPVPYMLFSWLGGMAAISLKKFILVSIVFRTMRFGSEGVLFYFFGKKARQLIEKHLNAASYIVIIILIAAWLAFKQLGKLFSP